MDLPTLRDASVAWTLDAWLYFCENPEIVRRAWENCKVDNLNFSWESLHSPEATRNLEQLLANDEVFRGRIGVNPDLPHSSDPAVRDAEGRITFDDNEGDSSATVDEVAAASGRPAGESLEVAAEDFSYVPDEDKDVGGPDEANGDTENSEYSETDAGEGPKPKSDEHEGECSTDSSDNEVNNYEELDTTPPASTFGDESETSLANMEMSPIVNTYMRCSPSSLPSQSRPDTSPCPPESQHIALDIATLGGTNPAALVSPIKPNKSTKPKRTTTKQQLPAKAKKSVVNPAPVQHSVRNRVKHSRRIRASSRVNPRLSFDS
jgi:hypothetical protein